MSKASTMSNPFEYQEIMAAAMQFGTTESVEDVVARHEKRHDEAEAEAKRKYARKNPTNARQASAPKPAAAPSGMTAPPKSEMSKLMGLLADAREIQGEPAAPPAAE